MSGRTTKPKPKPRVVLVMIVRDEEAIIGERLRAVRERVDAWLIVDTGSIDATVEIVNETLGDLPGGMYRLPWDWDGFATARNYAIAEAAEWAAMQGGEWWALLLDADTVLDTKPGWRKVLSARAELVSAEVVHGSIRYWHPRLLRLSRDKRVWRWRGVLHEYLVVPADVVQSTTSLLSVEHGSGGARSKGPDKYKRDAAVLREARLALGDGPDADLYTRYLFYEAQSWRDAGYPIKAEVLYRERATMGGWAQEVYISWLRVGEIRWADRERAGAGEAFMWAYNADPTRSEALIALATMAREREAWDVAIFFAEAASRRAADYRGGGLFDDVNVHWRALFEVSVAGWYVGQRARGEAACEAVLAADIPASVRERTEANLALYRGAR